MVHGRATYRPGFEETSLLLWPLLAMIIVLALPVRAESPPAARTAPATVPHIEKTAFLNPHAQTLRDLAQSLRGTEKMETRAAAIIHLDALIADDAAWKGDTALHLILRDARARLWHMTNAASLQGTAHLLDRAAERAELGPQGEALRAMEAARGALSNAMGRKHTDADMQPLIEDLSHALTRFLDTLNAPESSASTRPSAPPVMNESGRLHLAPELPMR